MPIIREERAPARQLSLEFGSELVGGAGNRHRQRKPRHKPAEPIEYAWASFVAPSAPEFASIMATEGLPWQ